MNENCFAYCSKTGRCKALKVLDCRNCNFFKDKNDLTNNRLIREYKERCKGGKK